MKEVLRVNWWEGQTDIAHAIRDYHRVAVKGGHGSGKTQASGGLLLHFLHSYSPAVVITTAPGVEQVLNETWRETRKQIRHATMDLLPGLRPVESFWHVNAETYGQGFSTDRGQRFRGKHSANMLFIFEEAEGIPSWALEEAENMCTAANNKILVIGNPILTAGWYRDLFKPDSGWRTVTLNCLDHPNVLYGREIYPGAVTRKWVEERIRKLCIPLDRPEDANPAVDFEFPRDSGKWYHPSPVFQSRVLGEFPEDDPDSLIPLYSVHHARNNRMEIDDTTPVDMGMDVAYRGGDSCVVFARRGPSVIKRRKWQGMDPTKSAIRCAEMATEFRAHGLHVGTIAVDAIGMGSGVASHLKAMQDDGLLQCDRVIAVQVSEKAVDGDHYADKRSELAFAMAGRFQQNQVDLTRLGSDADDFEGQATQIKRDYDLKLRYRVESKDKIRERIGVSPDDFDAMVLTYIDTVDTFAEHYTSLISVG